MFGDLELEFRGFAGEGESVIIVMIVIVFCGGGGGGGSLLDEVIDGLLLMLMLLLGSGRGGFSAGAGTCLDDWCADADGWWWFFCIWVGGKGGKGTVLYGAVAGWSAAEFAGCGAGG